MKPYLTVNGIFNADGDRRAGQRTVRTECETIVFQSVLRWLRLNLSEELKCAGSTNSRQPENPSGGALEAEKSLASLVWWTPTYLLWLQITWWRAKCSFASPAALATTGVRAVTLIRNSSAFGHGCHKASSLSSIIFYNGRGICRGCFWCWSVVCTNYSYWQVVDAVTRKRFLIP